MRKKTSSLLKDIAALKDCNVRVKMINKTTSAVVHNKSFDSFLGEKDKILKEWDVVEIVVVPKEAALTITETTEDSDAEETVLDDSGIS